MGPFPGCDGILSSGRMMRCHFWDVHSMDLVKVPKEGKFPRCRRCGMQVDPRYARHQYTKECQVGVKQKKQREVAVTLRGLAHLSPPIFFILVRRSFLGGTKKQTDAEQIPDLAQTLDTNNCALN